MLLLSCSSPAYQPSADSSLRESQLAQVDSDVLSSQFRLTGSPVPGAWRPHWDQGRGAGEERSSVAQLTEEGAGPDATITYVHPKMVFEVAARFSSHAKGGSSSLHQVKPDGKGKPKVTVTKRFAAGEKGDVPPEQEVEIDLEGPGRTGLSRCGFSWDDAAAKMGRTCNGKGFAHGGCPTPKKTTWNKNSYWYNKTYVCFTDLPDLNSMTGNGTERTCLTVSLAANDGWCQTVCNSEGMWCDPQICSCNGVAWATAEVFNTSASIQSHVANVTADELPKMNRTMLDAVKLQAEKQPSGLPSCTWRPPKGCSNTSQYECMQGRNQGKCSSQNWFDRPKSECEASCVHELLLPPAPYYALWYPGPLAKEFKPGDEQPRYKHAKERFSLRARGLDLSVSDVIMSGICKSSDNKFVGISLYSPAYKAKAERLVRSCSRVGVCCKATLLPSDAFGPDAPEGSEAFRFQTIASKPSFILGEMAATHLPVVFLDTDLEFHRFPTLFVPGSWPNGPRDMAIFNFWGNETDLEHASTPTTGSGVVFFNQTHRARALLTAWSEAMAWEANTKAPDDQVLDLLLKEGGWIARTSVGYLPSSYLRNMPAYYRGVDPVIDHDHGNMPGLAGHSEAKPELPPIERLEASDPHHDDPDHVHETAPLPRPEDLAPVKPVEPVEPVVGTHQTFEHQLPPGTCQATRAMDPERWSSWCDRSCGPDKWGTVALGGCTTGSETAVGCKCKAGVKALRTEEGDAPSAAAVAPVVPAVPVAPAPQAGECLATNPTLTGASQGGWDAWCAHTCQAPTGRPELCATPALTGNAMCKCGPVLQ